MSSPELNDNGSSLRNRIGQPFRTLFQEGFLATWGKHTLFSLIGLSLLFVTIASGIWWFGLREGGSPGDSMADGGSLDKSVGSSSTVDLEKVAEELRMDEAEWQRRKQAGRRAEEIALAKYRLTCVRQLANRAQEAINVCRDEAVEWAEDMKDFENSPVDWSEASNHALLGRIDMLLSLETPSKSKADDLLDQYKELTAPLDQSEALADATGGSGSLESKLEKLKEDARSTRDLYQRRRAMLRSIRGAVQVSSQENLPNIRAALDDYRTELASEQEARIDKQLAEVHMENEAILRRAKEEAGKAVTEAKREAAEIEGQIESERAKADAQRKKVLQEVADAEAQLKTDREKLEREFQMDLAKIEHYLVAFLTPDNQHPLKKMTIEKMPYPFSYIESRGALIETDRGLQCLFEIVVRDVGERPGGPFPHRSSFYAWKDASAEQRQPVIIAQQLLRKYGLLMVEKKMLLP